MNSELVSIIIPTYNRYDYLSETLDSVLNQTYPSWECIIVDDGSGDYTDELVGFYTQLTSNIKYKKRPLHLPKGANSCRNYGFELSSGTFIMWLDDDDVLEENKLQKQLEVALPDSDCLITCAWGRLAGYDTNRLKLSIYRDYDDPINLLVDYAKLEYFPSHVFLCSRSLVEKSPAWDNNLKINQDGVFFAGIIINASKIRFAKDTQVYYRAHTENNTSNLNSLNKAYELIRSWEIVEAMIPEERKKDVSIFLFNIRRYIYRRFKEEGYRGIIIKNLFLFRYYILEDLQRKIKEIRK